MSSRERVLELSRKLSKAKSKADSTKLLHILESLRTLPMSIPLLKESELGKKVNQIRKSEVFKSQSQIKSAADSLVSKWKGIVTAQNKAKKASSGKGKRLKLKNSSSNNALKSPSISPHPAASDTSSSSTNGSNKNSSSAKSDTNNSDDTGYMREIYEWQTGDRRRDKMISKFIDVLRPRPDKEEYLCYMKLSADIESALTQHFGSDSDEYVQKYRDLHFNLKRNQELRLDVWEGHVKPHKLVTMSSEQMASKAEREKRDKDKKWAMEEARSDLALDVSQAMTDEYKCGKCKQRKCKYSQAQTRAADEPMTTFVTCLVCGNRWKC